MQRTLDLIISLFVLISLSPVFLLIVLLLKFTAEGEVLYIQKRVGRFGEVFGVYKFATMLKNSENIGTRTLTLKNDPRILPFGHFLRKSKLNELPQLVNVICGEMSLIGPRPQTPECFSKFPKKAQQKIVTVLPGISGVGSIIFRDEEAILNSSPNPAEYYRTVVMPYKGKLEEWYIAHRSVSLYLKCIFLTIYVVFFPRTNLIQKVMPGAPNPPQTLEPNWD